MTVTEPRAQQRSAAAEFVDFFAEGWGKGAGPQFFDHFESRIHPDVLMTQPLAPPARGVATFRAAVRAVVPRDTRPARRGRAAGARRTTAC